MATMLEQHLEDLGEPVVCVDADAIVRALQRPGQPGWVHMVEAFGHGILDPVTEEIQREEVARLVFSDSTKRELLNRIVHPMVREEERRLLDAAQEEGSHALLVVPLLYETGLDAWCDAVVVVTIPEDIRFARLARDRGMSEDQVRARLAGQLPEMELLRRATVALDNRGSLRDLRTQVAEAWAEILESTQL